MIRILKKTDNPIWISSALNAAALIVSVFVYRPFFEENDDAFLAMIAEGAYGVREPHLIYTNLILGYIYKALYSVCPAVRWHSILQYVFLFVALTAITYIVLKLCGEHDTVSGAQDGTERSEEDGTGRSAQNGTVSRRAWIPAIVILLTLSYEAYVSLQYSKTAALVCGIGYLCFLYTYRPMRSTDTRIVRITAYTLLIYGMLLRDSSFLLATLILLPLGIYEFIRLCVSAKKRAKAAGSFIVCFAAVGCLFLLFAQINKAAYEKDEEWKSFLEYNDTRMELLDYRYDLLDLNRYGSRLEELGISENDALLYLTWQFGDDRVLDTETMKAVLKGAPGREIIGCLKGLVQHIYEDVLIMNPLVIGSLLIFIYLISGLFARKDKGAVSAAVLQLIVFAGILVYYEYSGRWNHRIVFAALQLMAVSFAYMAAENAGRNEYDPSGDGGKSAVCAAAFVILPLAACLTVLIGNRLDHNDFKRTAPDYRAFFGSLSDNGDELFVVDTFTFQVAYRYDVFTPYEPGSLENFVAVGSWYVNSPVTKRITRRFGYENPFEALAGEDPRVVLVDNMYAGEKAEYLSEHYGRRTLRELPEQYGLKRYGIGK